MAATATTTPASTGTATANNDNTLGLIAHVLLILTWWLGPLILWIVKKEQGPAHATENAKEALNFGITLTLVWVGLMILTFVLGIVTGGLGFVLGFFAWVPWVAGIIFGILGAMAANKGQVYRYPVSLRLVK